MAMYRKSRSLIAPVAALSILLVLPMTAGARRPKEPHPTCGVAESWLNAAFDWLQGGLSHHGQGSGHPSTGALASTWETADPPPPPPANRPGGSCIDPQGDRPCIGIGG